MQNSWLWVCLEVKCNQAEISDFAISTDCEDVLLCCVYRPPNKEIFVFLNELRGFISKHSSNEQVLLVGGFNVDTSILSKPGFTYYLTLLARHGLENMFNKLFTKLVFSRIDDNLDSHQSRDQARVRKGYSTVDHICVVKQMIEKSAEYTRSLYMPYINYEKALDSVLTAVVLEKVGDHGIEETYIKASRRHIKGCMGRITLHKVSDKFPIPKGVIQGDTICQGY